MSPVAARPKRIVVYQVRLDFYLLNGNVLFLLTDPLRFLVEPNNNTATVGDSVWFHCVATGSPKPRITWLKHGQGGRPLDEEKYKAHENGSLNIRDVQLSDAGSYFCIAATNVDLKQITVHLEVKENSKQTDEELVNQIEMFSSGHMEFSQSLAIVMICVSTVINIVTSNICLM
ncbi:neural cell adhesion molecule L1-like [Orbicella faveolata]|uniref:neural cell adhesion molecule L1-like n=1 Tax=Orbicella faveolata TaxID=48498 RepID=UPI0009E3B881|nr:neural cell adhesion molecule L1-like [Orbicella faveolata]